MKQPVVRPLIKSEIKTLLQWTSEEGWKPGTHDMGIYHQLNPSGILGAFIDDEMVGTSAVFRYSPWFAFFGLYIVKAEYRGQGFGLAMTRHRLNLAGYRNIGLDGVQDKLSTYRQIGFRPAHLNQRYSFADSNVPYPEEVTDYSNIPLSTILKYDQAVFPADRSEFLKLWFAHPAFHKKIIIRNGELKGYIVLRPCVNNEWRLGGFVASSEKDSRLLLQAALSLSNGSCIYIDMPACNPDVAALVKAFNGQFVSECTRMYRGYKPELNHKKLYGITTLEAG